MDRCPKCKKSFFYFSETCPILDVYLTDSIRHIKYCSEKCMQEVVSTINKHGGTSSEQVRISFFERLSKVPLLWKIVLQPVDFKIMLLPENR